MSKSYLHVLEKNFTSDQLEKVFSAHPGYSSDNPDQPKDDGKRYDSGLRPGRPHDVGDEPGQRCRRRAHQRAQLFGRKILGILRIWQRIRWIKIKTRLDRWTRAEACACMEEWREVATRERRAAFTLSIPCQLTCLLSCVLALDNPDNPPYLVVQSSHSCALSGGSWVAS